MSLDITPVSVEGTEDVALPRRGDFVSVPMPRCRVWRLPIRGLYVLETEWGENIVLLATMCAEEGGKQLSAFPGNILTSSVTDSCDMANDSLDCHYHRYDDHYNHQQGSNY